jgi:hypothetical protein
MKTYTGERTSAGGQTVLVIDGPSPRRMLDPRRDLRNHSLDGFEWGYGGSGPAQLALALLADALGSDDRALAIYQDFKWFAVSGFGNAWSMTSQEIVEWANRREMDLAAAGDVG